MDKIERREYKNFYITHVIRPYQGMIIDSNKRMNYSVNLWLRYPEFRENREWLNRVTNRISEIYDTVDPDFFPCGETKTYFLSDLKMAGLKIDRLDEL